MQSQVSKSLVFILALSLIGCSDDKLQVITNGDRVASLEERAALNDELNKTQNSLISLGSEATASLEARVSSLEGRAAALEADLAAEIEDRVLGDDQLEEMVAQEAAARQAGDLSQASALQTAIAQQQAINSSTASSIAGLQHSLAVALAAQSLTNILVSANLALLNGKVSVLQGQVSSLTSRMSLAETSLSSVRASLVVVQSDISSLKSRTTALESGVSSLTTRMSSAEASLSTMQADILYLKSKVVTIVDPCPSVANTEILLRVEGKLVGFYQGTEGFLSIIGNGSYRTTDPSQCHFSVSNNQII